MEDSHYRHPLDELDVLVSLEGELVYLDEELVDAHVFGKFFLELHREVLLDVVELVGLGRLRHDLIHEGHVALQVLELHVVAVLGIPPRRLVHLDVVALAPLVRVDVGVAVPKLAQRLFRLDVVDILASGLRCA